MFQHVRTFSSKKYYVVGELQLGVLVVNECYLKRKFLLQEGNIIDCL